MRKFTVPAVVLALTMLFSWPGPRLAAQEPDPHVNDTATSISVFPSAPPVIDGSASADEWAGSSRIALSRGTLYVANDAINLYLLIDVTADTQADNPGTGPTYDYFWLTFDVNRDGVITPNIDVNYATILPGYTLCRAFYLGSHRWSGCGDTHSRLAAGYGATPSARAGHRFWELAISLDEISAAPGNMVRLGVRTSSVNPAFTVEDPPGFGGDFANLLPVRLVRKDLSLLILADESFLPALAPLKEHKDYTGMPAYVQSWQSLNHSLFAQGRDEAERVKRGIAAYKLFTHISYVLLVGDTNRFPVRYTMIDRATAAAYNRAFYATDLYYADLYESDGSTFETWDANNNAYYGELHGETLTGVLNVDQVDLNPDVAVGRAPASTAAEVTTYVNKVINHEFNAYKAPWLQQALMVATTDWVADACQTKEWVASNALTGYTVHRLYQAGNSCATTSPPTSANINARLNAGVRFANYVGHGYADGWQIPGDYYTASDFTGLSNQDRLTIAFAAACDTTRYATQPPYDPYTDNSGVHHRGTSAGEVFTNVPPQPAALQITDNPGCFGEQILVEHAVGAVGYIGCATGAQPFATDLDRFFFRALTAGATTLGDMWNYAVRQYYVANPPPATITSPDWTIVARMHQPWKYHLFGDPSLRINGVSRVQKADFVGLYRQNHDGWQGRLELWALADDYIEQLPNVGGRYTGSDGRPHSVRGYVRTWSYPLPEANWPDHMMRFYVNFPDTATPDDDQRFEGYLFTQTRDAMAGLTWWNNIPFGFYATKAGGLEMELAGEPVAPAAAAPAVFSKTDFAGRYRMVHDGWPGTLELRAVADNYPAPNLTGTYRGSDGRSHAVRGYVRTATYPLPSDWGPDHKIALYIDLNDTADSSDDQYFAGYLFTQTKSALAGYTVWSSTRFGFYAIKQRLLYLPIVVKR